LQTKKKSGPPKFNNNYLSFSPLKETNFFLTQKLMRHFSKTVIFLILFFNNFCEADQEPPTSMHNLYNYTPKKGIVNQRNYPLFALGIPKRTNLAGFFSSAISFSGYLRATVFRFVCYK